MRLYMQKSMRIETRKKLYKVMRGAVPMGWFSLCMASLTTTIGNKRHPEGCLSHLWVSMPVSGWSMKAAGNPSRVM